MLFHLLSFYQNKKIIIMANEHYFALTILLVMLLMYNFIIKRSTGMSQLNGDVTDSEEIIKG